MPTYSVDVVAVRTLSYDLQADSPEGAYLAARALVEQLNRDEAVRDEQLVTLIDDVYRPFELHTLPVEAEDQDEPVVRLEPHTLAGRSYVKAGR